MNVLIKGLCRIIQRAFYMAIPILPYRKPEIYEHVSDAAAILAEQGVHSVLLVTDSILRQSGLTQELEQCLIAEGVHLAVYDKTQANPTVHNAQEARDLYIQEKCQALIAFGGGSSIDCAKAAGAMVVYPRKTPKQLAGLLKIWRKLPPFIAIPTTAGTGSEVTVTAVITDSEKKHKYTMNSFPLMPHYAVLDPSVTVTLPPHLTATTGMDALTHAVEAYIGNSTTAQTRANALDAAWLIFEYLPRAYADGNDMEARENMLLASYKAGVAFSKSYVGYVHAVAHSLGGQYNVPHGLANAVLLPVVLEAYGSSIYEKLYQMAVAVGVANYTDSPAAASWKFIQAIRDMNQSMGIPTAFSQIRSTDIPTMARHAAKEANPLYPVPKIMDRRELERFYGLVSDRVSVPSGVKHHIRKKVVYEHG